MGGKGSGRIPDPVKMFTPERANIAQSGGGTPYEIPNLSGDLSRGRVLDTPVNPKDPVSKEYVDTAVAGGGGGNVNADANLTDETLVQGDGGAKKIKTSTATVAHIEANTSHAGTTTGNPHIVLLDEVGNPSGDTSFNFAANKHLHFQWTGDWTGDDGAFDIEATGNFSGDLLHIHQHSGNVTAPADLVHLEAEDAQVTNLRLNNTQATNVFEVGPLGSPTMSITNLGVITWPSGGSAATNTHLSGDGSDHADVAINTLKDSSMWETKDATTNWFKTAKHIDMDNRGIIGVLDPTSAQGAANKQYVDNDNATQDTAIGLNTTHRGSDGSDHSIVGSNTTAIGLNTTHRGSAGGTDHSDVNTNNSKVSYTKTNVKGHIEHGGTAGTGRPSGFTSVEWIGTVEPSNAVNGDTWLDTS